MTNLTVEQTDEIIDKLHSLAILDDELELKLKNLDNWQTRWFELESFVVSVLENVDIDYWQFQDLWIRERFFYEMQQRTGQDYGFCDHFVPAYRRLTQSMLENDFSIDMWHKCTYDTNEPIDTTCNGTARDYCAVLHPELKSMRESAIENYVVQEKRKAKSHLN